MRNNGRGKDLGGPTASDIAGIDARCIEANADLALFGLRNAD
jgi:hypothetical protein